MTVDSVDSRISVAVQHHPSRGRLLPLLERLGGFELVVDPEPYSYSSPMRCYLEALRRTPARATHRVIVQDDALPCAGFRERLEAAVAERPDDVIALFVPGRSLLRKLLREAHERGDRWVEFPRYNWAPTVALCWPRELALEYLAFGEAVVAERAAHGLTTHGDDPYVGQWRKARGWPPLMVTVPCLVEHPDVEGSIFRPLSKPRAGANRSRVAALYCG